MGIFRLIAQLQDGFTLFLAQCIHRTWTLCCRTTIRAPFLFRLPPAPQGAGMQPRQLGNP